MIVRTLALVAMLLPATAHGHGRSVSYSRWTLTPTGAGVELRLAAIDVTLLGLDPWSDATAVASYAAGRLTATIADRPCAATPPRVDAPEDGFVALDWQVDCAGPPETILMRLFDDVAPTHIHFARVVTAAGAVSERVLMTDEPRWVLSTGATVPAPVHGSSFVDYVRLGIDHIRTGYDHLAFVLALVLLATSLPEVATIVTAFTVAHSLTLAVAVLGVVHPPPAAVEALIGFSIALVAFENAWLLGGRGRASRWLVSALLVMTAIAIPGAVAPATLLGLALFATCHLGLLAQSDHPARLRALVAFGFGLVHGFGFAGVLAEMDLPRARIVPALVGFNVGVELGQLAVVAVGWSLLVALERLRPGARRRVAETGSAVVCGLGLYWFVTRAWG